MPSGSRKYTFFYRIYRRIRFLRYVSRLRKRERKVLRMAEKEEARERKERLRTQSRLDRISDKERKRQEEARRLETLEELRKAQEKDLEINAEKYEREKEFEASIKAKNKYHRRRSRRRLLRFYMKVCRKNTLKFIGQFNPLKLPELIRQVRENRKLLYDFVLISIQSTILFVAAYLMIFLIGLFTAAISGKFFDYNSIIYFHEVFWLVKPDQWYGDSVKMIYASPPIVSGIIAVFLAIIFSYIHTDRALGKLFILWSLLHGFNAFFGSLLIGSIFGKGFGYAIIWAYISDTEKVIYSIISILALFLIGVFTSRSFLVSANSYYASLENRKQRFFIWAQAIVPFLLGNMLIGMIMFPRILVYNMTVSLTLIIAIIPIGLAHRFYPSMYFEEEDIGRKFRPSMMIYALVFIVLYRLVLGFGVPL